MTLSVRRDGENVVIRAVYGPTAYEIAEYRGHALSFWHQLGALVIDGAEDRARQGYARFIQRQVGAGNCVQLWEGLSADERSDWIAAFTEL